MSAGPIEQRVSELEKQVAVLTREVLTRRLKPGWIQRVLGSMEGDADFTEILRLGRETRQADRTDPDTLSSQ